MLVREATLRSLITDIFAAGGSEAAEAAMLSDHLVDANLYGHDSHGVGMVPTYIKHVKSGRVFANRPVTLAHDGGALMVFDGGLGYGRRAAGEAMAQAVARARETGVVAFALRNAHHIGRVGRYGEMGIEAGFVSIHFVNVADHGPLVAPHRGSDARFSTNPFCVGIPAGRTTKPLLLDMATSKVAMGKVRVAYNEGKALAPGLVMDDRGQPSTDPSVMFREPMGALTTFAEHKGYALALVCEILAGGLGGGGTIQPATPRKGGIINSMFSVVIDPARLVDMDWLGREIDAMIAYAKGSPAADPALPVLVPGEPERLSAEARRRDGVPIDPTTWGEIMDAARRVGLDPQALERRAAA